MSNENSQTSSSIWSCISLYFYNIVDSNFYSNISQYTERFFCVSKYRHNYTPLNEET